VIETLSVSHTKRDKSHAEREIYHKFYVLRLYSFKQEGWQALYRLIS